MEVGALRAEKQQNEEIVRNLKDPVIRKNMMFHLHFICPSPQSLWRKTGQNHGDTQDILGSIQHLQLGVNFRHRFNLNIRDQKVTE